MAAKIPPVLQLYSVMDGFIGKIHVPEDLVTKSGTKLPVETIIILDISGSMGDNVRRLSCEVLPEMLRLLNYAEDDPVTLITFESHATTYKTSGNTMKQLGLHCMGSTNMTAAIENLKICMEEIGKEEGASSPRPIRLLTVSDGVVDDQEGTVRAASNLAPIFKGRLVNSRAVRYFTSRAQPDTRGLASVIQFSTVDTGTCGLVDLEASVEVKTAASEMAAVFLSDGLGYMAELEVDHGEAKYLPWAKGAKAVSLARGENILWFSEIPSTVAINGHKATVEQRGPLTFDNIAVIESKLNSLSARFRLLKVVNSEQAVAEIALAKEYLDKWGASLASAERQQSVSTAPLKNRLVYFRNLLQRRMRGIFMEMSQILSDERVHALNLAQQASYLREVDGSKNSKALARRAMKEGLDFKTVLEKEVEEMRTHMNELGDVDDSSHFVSFYSYASTLAGIKALCELKADEAVFDCLTPMEILQVANIVGVACQAPVGDYPEPMVWRLNKFFPGIYVSISDLIVAYEASGNQQHLTIPQTNEQITSVVPYFEDERVQRFLQTHAPNLLEYTCSVGMRNVLAGVHGTFYYTLAAGLWNLVEEINRNKYEVNISTFCQIVKSMKMGVTKTSHEFANNLLEAQPLVDGKMMSFYLVNNGTQNLMGPMIVLAKRGQLMSPNLPRVLRALYSHEIYMAVRKWRRREESNFMQVIHDLIGVDFGKFGTKVAEPFEDEPSEPAFHSECYLDDIAEEKLRNLCSFIDYITLMPVLIQLVYCHDPISAIKALPPMSEQTMQQALGISIETKLFKLYNLLQATVYDTQAKRVNDELKRMNFVDLGVQSQADDFVKTFVRDIYRTNYEQNLKLKSAREIDLMAKELVALMLSSQTVAEFCQLISSGFSHRSGRTYQILNSSSVGFAELVAGLADLSKKVPERLQKIAIVLTGRDENGQAVWNSGNRSPVNRNMFTDAFAAEGVDMLQVPQIRDFGCHNYRSEKPNRHTHCNEKPSYWAFGYQTIDEFFTAVGSNDETKYRSVHTGCCGL